MWPAMTWRAKAAPIHVAAARMCMVNSIWSTRIRGTLVAGIQCGSVAVAVAGDNQVCDLAE